MSCPFKNVYKAKHHFWLFYYSKVNSTQNVYKKYNKLINSKLPSWPETSPNLKLCLIKIAHRATYMQLLWLFSTALTLFSYDSSATFLYPCINRSVLIESWDMMDTANLKVSTSQKEILDSPHTPKNQRNFVHFFTSKSGQIKK